MLVYRVSREKYAYDLSGEGARLHGGRWNHLLTPCVYSSASRALALLEFSVHITAEEIPMDLVMMTIEVDDSDLMEVAQDKLPADWQQTPVPVSTQDLGNLILNETDLLLVGVPSVVVPREYNYLINPRFVKGGNAVVIHQEKIDYDLRIKW